MTHDYKHAAHPKSGPAPIPLWVWIFALVAVSSFVGLLYYLEQYEKGNIGTNHKANIKKLLLHKDEVSGKNATAKAPAKKKDDKPTFDFYSLLPSMEMIIPDKEKKVRDEEVPRQANASSTTKTQYILQAGSFRDEQQADRLKAGLALLGIETTIEPVKIAGSGTWHRVRAGPFTNLREIDQVRSRMRANNIDPILLTEKP